MVKLDVVEILKKHGLYTDEFRTRMDILQAVMNREWNHPILKKNFTRQQIEEMAGQPEVQQGGADIDAIKEQADAVTASPVAGEAAAKAAGIAQTALAEIPGAAALKDKAADIQQRLAEKFADADPVKGLAKQVDYDANDGTITMLVKTFLNTLIDTMSSPAFPELLRAIFGAAFVLSYAEGLPIFGGMIKAALEIAAFILPTIGTSILSTATSIGGPIGHMVGLLVSGIFFILAAMIAFSRKQFTEAVVASANLIPFVGILVANTIQKADTSAKKIIAAQKQVYNSFLDILGVVFSVKGPVRGGMRLSRRRKYTKKWRTQKRRRTSGRR
jgi:hypothetical protein